MPPLELTDGIKSCIEMAEAALGVKNIVSAAATASVSSHCTCKYRRNKHAFVGMQALDTLSTENDTLKKENSQLVSLATAKGVSLHCYPWQQHVCVIAAYCCRAWAWAC
jgi:hypothetical protein